MEIVNLEKDIKVLFVTALIFPEGILAAWQKIDAICHSSLNRQRFGISCPDKSGRIVYNAAVEELELGEAEKFGMEAFVIKSGQYITLIAHDYTKDTQNVSKAFQQLLTHTDIDPEGYCLEWYLNEKDVRCMVGLKKILPVIKW
jgi:predicted transcriptional regulator YdeE